MADLGSRARTAQGLLRVVEQLVNRARRNRSVYADPGVGSSGTNNGVQTIITLPASSQAPPRPWLPLLRRRPKTLITLFLMLPVELQLLILSFLDFGDMERLRRTCHMFREFITKPMIRDRFGGDLREELLLTCSDCLCRQASKQLLVREELTDARYPLANRCMDCVAWQPGFMVGCKYVMGNAEEVYVCRWCGYPVVSQRCHNVEFHHPCYKTYNRVTLLYLLTGLVQWIIAIVAMSLCWRYYGDNAKVVASAICNFLVMLWVASLSTMQGFLIKAYHWLVFLEGCCLVLWIPPVMSIGYAASRSSEPMPTEILVTFAFIGLNMLFRFISVIGNIVLLAQWKMWRRNRPRTPPILRIIYKVMMFLVWWVNPMSVEHEYPGVWLFWTPEDDDFEEV